MWSRLAFLSVIVFLVGGCATPSPRMTRTYSGIQHPSSTVDYPASGETRTAEVGESLIWKVNQTTIPAIDIEQPIIHPTENLGKNFVITLLPGKYVQRGRDATGFYYMGEKGSLLVDGEPLTALGVGMGLYVNGQDFSKTEIFVLPTDGRPLLYPKNGIPFKSSFYETQNKLSFKRELVYAGVSQNVASIIYREFKDDFARPAFSQEYKYDLSEGRMVGYRGARFEILKATNQGITYRTVKQLD